MSFSTNCIPRLLDGCGIVIEPRLTTRDQAWSWSAGFATFAVLCVATASFARKVEGSGARQAPARALPILWRYRLQWLALAACLVKCPGGLGGVQQSMHLASSNQGTNVER